MELSIVLPILPHQLPRAVAVTLLGQGKGQVLCKGKSQSHLVLLQYKLLLIWEGGVLGQVLKALQQFVRLVRGEENLVSCQERYAVNQERHPKIFGSKF